MTGQCIFCDMKNVSASRIISNLESEECVNINFVLNCSVQIRHSSGGKKSKILHLVRWTVSLFRIYAKPSSRP
jgi:hypothetical protein